MRGLATGILVAALALPAVTAAAQEQAAPPSDVSEPGSQQQAVPPPDASGPGSQQQAVPPPDASGPGSQQRACPEQQPQCPEQQPEPGERPELGEQPEPEEPRPGNAGRGSRLFSGFTGLARGRLRLHVNGAFAFSSRQSEVETTFRAYGEPARFRLQEEFPGGGTVDVGGSLRIWRELAIGASYTQMTNGGRGVVNGTAPHPIETGRDRTAPERAIDLPHRQQAMQVYAAWRISLRGLDVELSAGPTYFHLRRGVVAGLSLREVSGPPFAEVDLALAAGEHARNGVGYNAGIDVTLPVTPANSTPWIGLGWFARMTGGSVALPGDGLQAPREVRVGGPRTGVGLRLVF